MTRALEVSQILQWVVLAAVVATLATLARQIGLLHVRLPPSGARVLPQGPAIGSRVPAFEEKDVHGNQVRPISPDRETLLIFITTRCSTCVALLPALKAFASAGDGPRVVLVSLDDERATRSYVKAHQLTMPVVAAPRLSDRYQVGITPYAFLVDREGLVKAAGMVNNMEHLESIVYVEPEGREGPDRPLPLVHEGGSP